MAAMCEQYGHEVTPWVHVDASAAIGFAQRKGLGRVRHLSTQSLWIQDAVREKRLTLEKVNGSDNPADLLTKHVPAEIMERHMRKVGLQQRDGCAASAPKLVRGRDPLELEMQSDHLDINIDSLEVVEEHDKI